MLDSLSSIQNDLSYYQSELARYQSELESAKINFPYPSNYEDEIKKKVKLTSLKQLPTKQKIDGKTIITQKLIDLYKYTPEELKIIEDEKEIYYDFLEEVDDIVYKTYRVEDGDDDFDYRYTANDALVAINKSIYAIEALLKYGNDEGKCYCSIMPHNNEDIINILDDKYGYMLRILSNLEYYNNQHIYKIYNDDDIIKTSYDLNKFMTKIIGKSVKHCFNNFLLEAVTEIW